MAAVTPVVIVWHKATDLRIHDHEMIALAHAEGVPVIHLFCFDPFWWAPLPLTGYPRQGRSAQSSSSSASPTCARPLSSMGRGSSV
eukprot:CAMPEP_0182833436 /NCGR_PEP_ID=MMETSP0006_2-20121128/20295_1 /TAXON_ID=97485 /ORGANISM="Prymnesium parvum, Strain Texoma1" /LENGTH=85 /DNA_ID=CAMNT_0024961445 /DNA_START=299 /DNA_END=553 /DNA_ORIENTATION=+